MTEFNLCGNVFVDVGSPMCNNSYGVSVVTRNSLGQGWGMDLTGVTPEDLRTLADYLQTRLGNAND